MKSAKHTAPKKTTRKKRAIYSLPPKKKSKVHLHGVNGGHAKSGNGVLHEEATAYHTQFGRLASTVRTLDRQKLDVVNKTRSNIFGWRGQFTPEFVAYLLDEANEGHGVGG